VAIRPGDLLTSSSIAGYAMRAHPTLVHGVQIYPTGTIVGEALQPLKRGRGEIGAPDGALIAARRPAL